MIHYQIRRKQQTGNNVLIAEVMSDDGQQRQTAARFFLRAKYSRYGAAGSLAPGVRSAS